MVGVGIPWVPSFVGDVGDGGGGGVMMLLCLFVPEFGEEICNGGGSTYFVEAEGCVIIHASRLAQIHLHPLDLAPITQVCLVLLMTPLHKFLVHDLLIRPTFHSSQSGCTVLYGE